MGIESKILTSVMAMNLTVETFVRSESLRLMSNAFSWLEIITYEVLLAFRENLLVLSQLSTQLLPVPYSHWHGHY